MATEYRKIVDLIFEPQGKHDPAVSYKIKDTVMSADGSQVYFAIQDVPAGVALTDTSYWKKQIDLAASKSAMDNAAANAKTQTDNVIASAQERVDDLVEEAANSVAQMQDYTSEYSTRVHGESAVAYGNPMEIYPDEGSLLKPVTEIKLKQEGEGNPYPAGGGKNLFNPNELSEYLNTTVNGDTLTTTFEDGRIHVRTREVFNPGTYTLSFVSEKLYLHIFIYDASTGATIAAWDVTDWNRGYTFTANDPFVVAFGGPGDSSNRGTYSYKVQLELGNQTSKYAPCENIRPIIGYDALNLKHHAGNNLFGGLAFAEKLEDAASATIDKDAGTVFFHGKDIVGNRAVLFDGFKPNTQYTIILYGKQTANTARVANMAINYTDGGLYQQLAFQTAGEYSYCILQTPSDRSVKNLFAIYADESVTLYYDKCGIFEGAVTLEDFEEFQGDTYTAQPGKTICCGRMDWTTGELLVEYEKIVLDGVNTPVITVWENALYVCSNMTGRGYKMPKVQAKGVCSHFLVTPGGVSSASVHFSHDSYGSVYIGAIPGVNGADAYNAYLQTNPITCVYELQEPYIIQFTPHQILALKGANTIYGDGDLTVEYYKPISSLVDRYNALVEATTDPFRVSGNPVTCQTIRHQELEVVTEFGPKQEGSGTPYPAGGGKNLISLKNITVVTMTNVSASVYDNYLDIRVTGMDGGFQQWHGRMSILDDWKGKTYTLSAVVDSNSNFGSVSPRIFMLAYDANNVETQIAGLDFTNSYAGNASFTIPEDAVYLRFLFRADQNRACPVGSAIYVSSIQLEEGATQTAFAPYENIRPISGLDALNLTRCGKNLLTKQFMDNTALGIAGEGIVVSYYFEGRSAMMDIPLAPGTYTVSGPDILCVYVYYDESRIPDMNLTYNYDVQLPYTFTISKPGYFAAHCLHDEKNIVQLERGSVATAYESPVADVFNAQIGQMIYGGRMDWNTGKLYCNLCKITFDGVTLGRKVDRTDPGVTHYAYIDAANMPYPIKPYGLCISNKTTGTIMLVLGFGLPKSLTGCVPGDDVLTVAAKYNAVFKAWYDAGDPLEFVYEIAEPFVIQLTPKQILALQGANTFYGDGDTITVEGRQPKHIAIEERVAALEALMLNA